MKCLNTVGTILCTPLNPRTARFETSSYTYLPTLASDRALQKLYAMLPHFPNLLQDGDFSKPFQTTCDYILSTSTTRFVAGAARDPFSIYFRQVGR